VGLETDANLARPFRLHRPRSVAEAVALLADLASGGDEVVVMSGGQSLTVMLTSGLATPDHVVSLALCDDLPGLDVIDGQVVLGARTTVAEVERHTGLARSCPALTAACAVVGSPHVRAFGTVVGNVCHADPGGDVTLPLLCFDAELVVLGPTGERVVAVADLVQGPYTTVLRPGEFGLVLRFTPPPASGQAYRKIMRRQGDLALASACAVIERRGDRIVDARVALGGLLGRAQRLPDLEALLVGRPWGPVPDRADVARCLGTAWSDLLTDPDDPASADYLQELALSLTGDVIARAMAGDRG